VPTDVLKLGQDQLRAEIESSQEVLHKEQQQQQQGQQQPEQEEDEQMEKYAKSALPPPLELATGIVGEDGDPCLRSELCSKPAKHLGQCSARQAAAKNAPKGCPSPPLARDPVTGALMSFPHKLWAILEAKPPYRSVAWASDSAIIVRDVKLLEAEVLPLYFTAGCGKSFLRQLNMYGFMAALPKNMTATASKGLASMADASPGERHYVHSERLFVRNAPGCWNLLVRARQSGSSEQPRRQKRKCTPGDAIPLSALLSVGSAGGVPPSPSELAVAAAAAEAVAATAEAAAVAAAAAAGGGGGGGGGGGALPFAYAANSEGGGGDVDVEMIREMGHHQMIPIPGGRILLRTGKIHVI